jgi:hypothetical protein
VKKRHLIEARKEFQGSLCASGNLSSSYDRTSGNSDFVKF